MEVDAYEFTSKVEQVLLFQQTNKKFISQLISLPHHWIFLNHKVCSLFITTELPVGTQMIRLIDRQTDMYRQTDRQTEKDKHRVRMANRQIDKRIMYQLKVDVNV